MPTGRSNLPLDSVILTTAPGRSAQVLLTGWLKASDSTASSLSPTETTGSSRRRRQRQGVTGSGGKLRLAVCRHQELITGGEEEQSCLGHQAVKDGEEKRGSYFGREENHSSLQDHGQTQHQEVTTSEEKQRSSQH